MSSPAITIKGLKELERMTRGAPAELRREVRSRSKAIAEPIAARARNIAAGHGSQVAATASTIRAVAAGVPTIKAGGAKRVTSSGAPAGDFYHGGTFGGEAKQFPGFVTEGRDIYPAIRESRERIAREYLDGIEEVFGGR